MELNQNGQIQVDEVPTSAPVLLSSSYPDGGAAVLSIHEQSNGNIINNHHDTSIVTNGDLTDAAANDVQKLNGLSNSINADVAAVGSNKQTNENKK